MSQSTYPIPPVLQRAITAAFGLLAASAAIGVVLSAWPMPKPAWFMLVFEPTVLAASVIGLLAGRGKFNDAPALAIACCAVVAVVGSALALLAVWSQPIGRIVNYPLMARLGLGIVLLAVSGAMVLSRERGSWRDFVIGALLVSPVLGSACALVLPQGRRALDWLGGQGGVISFAIAAGGFLVVTVLLCAGTHLIISAFQRGQKPA